MPSTTARPIPIPVRSSPRCPRWIPMRARRSHRFSATRPTRSIRRAAAGSAPAAPLPRKSAPRPRKRDMAELTDLDLVELADAIRARQVSSREATEVALARARAVQPTINAFVAIDNAGARAAADAADAVLTRGGAIGPLHGVPLAHKDMFFRRGRISGCGSAIMCEMPADRTATVLDRLDAAGALDIARLNMAEFAFGPTGHNVHYGDCCNPWDPSRITGGSSSGSGASVAAGAVWGALGSDTGGSVRLPAAICGIVGIKPTQTRVSRYGVMGLSFSLDN